MTTSTTLWFIYLVTLPQQALVLLYLHRIAIALEKK